MPDTAFSIDLADVGGYGYHSGVKFALYAEGWRDALVSGGRYDDVSRAFGRARPATGFSLDLRSWRPVCRRRNGSRGARALGPGARPDRGGAPPAPVGEIVVQVLPGHEQDQDEFVCDRELALQDGAWTVRTL